MGAAYFHVSVSGDFFAEIKPRIREGVISGVNFTLSDMRLTIDFIGRNRRIHFLEEIPELWRRRVAAKRRAILKALKNNA